MTLRREINVLRILNFDSFAQSLKRDPEELQKELARIYLRAYEDLPQYAYTDLDSTIHYIKWLRGERGSKGWGRSGHIFLIALLEESIGENGNISKWEPVGFAAGDSLWRDSELGLVANFHEIAVDPRYQGMGIGKKLILELIKEFFKFNPRPRDVMLWVGLENTRAETLYRKLGFSVVSIKGIWKKMRLPYEKVKAILSE